MLTKTTVHNKAKAQTIITIRGHVEDGGTADEVVVTTDIQHVTMVTTVGSLNISHRINKTLKLTTCILTA